MKYVAEIPTVSASEAELNVIIVGHTNNTVSYVLSTSDGKACVAMWSKIILSDFIEELQ